MNDVINNGELRMLGSIEALNKKLNTIRAGKASASMLDSVKVEYYGTMNPLNAVGTIGTPDAFTLVVKPFDKSSLGAIEKAIVAADLGLNPTNNGETIIINVPRLTEDRRKEYVKQAKAVGEEAKVAIRNIRQDCNNTIKRNAELNDNEKDQYTSDVQELTNKFNKNVEEVLAKKEKELLLI